MKRSLLGRTLLGMAKALGVEKVEWIITNLRIWENQSWKTELRWTKIFLPEIKELIETKDFKGLRDFLRERHPADIVDIRRELEPAERVMSFRLLDKKNKISEVFTLFEPIEQEELLKRSM
jgi:hypothetical protein